MIYSVLMMNLEPSPNNPKPSGSNSLIEIAKIVMSKANFTRGQWFYFGFLVLYLAFFTIMAISPTVIYVAALFTGRELSEIKPPVPLNNLLNGLYVVLVVGLIYFILYSYPELRAVFVNIVVASSYFTFLSKSKSIQIPSSNEAIALRLMAC